MEIGTTGATVAPSAELMDRMFGGVDAISVQQTMRGCVQECFGCEAESEYKIYPGHVEEGQPRAEVCRLSKTLSM